MGRGRHAGLARHSADGRPGDVGWTRRLPWAVVGVAILYGAVVLRGELIEVWHLNDASVHGSMVRWAAERIRGLNLPFDGWFPYLSLGASRFHHYQSLPHITTGAVSVLFGPGTFRWSLYLLLVTWPIAVYAGGRLLGLGPWPAAIAALAAPLVSSAAGMGYEWGSYTWRGSGAWAQLWGMWALPFAWGTTWRAVSGRGRALPAALVLGATICLHLLTGYLAVISLGVWVLVSPREALVRLRRAAVVLFGALSVAAWMLVPLLVDADWSVQDEFSRGTFYYDSFGAAKVLGWLGTGGLFDHGRAFPSITILLAVGLVVTGIDARRRDTSRALLGVAVVSLLLFFGRPTLGPVIDLLPGGGDLFLRRFIAGVHLAGLYLVGLGGVGLVATMLRGARHLPVRLAVAPGVAAVLVAGLLFIPAWMERARYASEGAAWIRTQARAEASDGVNVKSLVEIAAAAGDGRIFAGLRGRSEGYRVGYVPIYASLLAADVDQVGFTRPTWSLTSRVEDRFDADQPGHVELFGVRYLLFPKERTPPPGFEEVARAGPHILWMNPSVGYVSVRHTVAPIAVDRSTIGTRLASVLQSRLPADGMLPLLEYGGRAPVVAPTLSAHQLPEASSGTVVLQGADPGDGTFVAQVTMREPGAVVAHASFDPRWEVTVDGAARVPEIVAPGLVAVTVDAGEHDVAFTYRPYPWYGPLLLFGLVVAIGLGYADRRASRRSSSDVLESAPGPVDYPPSG
jgi:hypothetical protein